MTYYDKDSAKIMLFVYTVLALGTVGYIGFEAYLKLKMALHFLEM